MISYQNQELFSKEIKSTTYKNIAMTNKTQKSLFKFSLFILKKWLHIKTLFVYKMSVKARTCNPNA